MASEPKAPDAPVKPVGDNLGAVCSVGMHVLVHVVPGWMLAGTITHVLGERLVLKDCTYLEGCAAQHAMTELCFATTAKGLRDIATTTWPAPDGMVVLPTLVMPMLRDARPLAKRGEAKAVEEA